MFTFGVYDRVGVGSITGGGGIIISGMGGMVLVSQYIWGGLESVNTASLSAVLVASAASLSAAVLESPLGVSVMFLNRVLVLWDFLIFIAFSQMNIKIFGVCRSNIIVSNIGGISSSIVKIIKFIRVGDISQFYCNLSTNMVVRDCTSRGSVRSIVGSGG